MFMPAIRVRWSANRSAEDAHIIAAGDLAGLLRGEAAAQHRRDEMHPLGVIPYSSRRNMLVGADTDVIDANHVRHLLQPFDVLIQAREEVPDADRTAGLRDRMRVISADLPPS